MIKLILTINKDNYTIYEKQNLIPQLKGIVDDELLELISPALDCYHKVQNLNEEIEELEQEVESLENEICCLSSDLDLKDCEIEDLENQISHLYRKLTEKNKIIRELKK